MQRIDKRQTRSVPPQAAKQAKVAGKEVSDGSSGGSQRHPPRGRTHLWIWLYACAGAISLVLFGLTARSVMLGAYQAVNAQKAPGGQAAKASPPPALAGLRQVGTGATTVTLAWNAVPGGAPYTIYRGAAPVGKTNGTTFTDRGLEGPATYQYTVEDHYGQRRSVMAQLALPWSTIESGGARSVALVTTYPSYLAVLSGRVEGGTGFIVSASCDVLTAYHVVRSAHLFIDVSLPGGEVAHARLLASDRGQDLALLGLPRGTTCGRPFRFASQRVAIGSPVGLLGHPGLGALSWVQGAVVGADEPVDVSTLGTLQEFPFHASVDPGDSGGPLLNHWGQVVGVVDARSSSSTGYAVPGTEAAAFVRQVTGR
ncbi:MAG: serine protease [Thermaerobacter sp.]|nr:serine protease [Thermaerobacter sp.]